MFIFETETERERERMSGGGTEREEDRGFKAGFVLTAVNPVQGSNPLTVRSLPEPKSDAQPTEPPRRTCLFAFNFFNVYLFLRGRQSAGGGGAERGRHRIPSRLQTPSCQHRARHGARIHKPRDHDLSQSSTY